MKKNPLATLFWCLVLLSVISCKKQDAFSFQKTNSDAVFPTSEKEKQTVVLLKEVGQILQSVYKKSDARYEVIAAIQTGYYVDERVLIKDLLFPQNSPLYNTDKFKASKAKQGAFKHNFLDVLSKGNYPNLKSAMGWNNLSTREFAADPGVDTTNEIWTNEYGISIYFPYSENFPLVNPNDPLNNTEYGNLVTIVYADREADSAPGWEPFYQPYDPTGNNCPDNICYNMVTVDDDYAELHPTHIVGIGAEQRMLPANPPPATNVVFIGEVKCDKKNYDHLITFNGYLQGGGPDLRFCRGSGYLTQDGNGQINSPQNVVQANPTRADCKHNRWISVYGVWDADWVPDNLNQVFAIYEEDKQGTSNVNISLQTTIKLDSSGLTGVGSVGFGWTFKTEDDIIRQLAWSRQSFFQYNQGGLNNGCGTRNSWTIYDCFSHVAYTMPTQ